ncbi:MAG: DNA methyltransferase, partial [Chloroflexales bacterium]
MATPTEVQQFIQHWEAVELNERAVAQSHFIALCALLGLRGPVEADPKGHFYRFEKALTKAGGAAGFADVWYKDRFAVEYKTKGKYATLREAYLQLLLYKDDLDNPPILIACDLAHYEIHVAFTGYPSRVHRFTNRDLENVATRDLLRQALTTPEALRPVEQADTITKTVAASFAKVAQLLEGRGFAPTAIAHFFMQVLFALFAEDIQLLPAELMSRSIRRAILNPAEFPERARALFQAMRVGGYFGDDRVPRFNGWLFNADEVLPLTADELTYLADAARHDWSAVEPAIFGTLFERSLDPTKRAQLGAHYTSREDILLIVEPVLMQPLRRQWAAVRAGVEALREQWTDTTGNAQRKLQHVAEGMLLDFMQELAAVRVLDPACGSGNFLYVALTTLKDLEHAVWIYAGGVGLRQPELAVNPAQLFGIEKNPFAAELAQVVVWIGYLQWLKTHGFLEGWPHEPVLQTLHTIENRDAILTVDLNGHPAEPPWPAV